MNENLPEGWAVLPFDHVLVSSRDLTYGVVQPGGHVEWGTPIVRVGDIRGGMVDLSEPLRIDPDIANRFVRSRIQGGELLISLVGTVGEVAVAPSAMRGWNAARAVGVARVREDIGARWVARALQQPAAKALIHSRLNTTVQATLNLKDLRDVPIVLPPPKVRKEIAHLSDAIDDKIDSNRRLITAIPQLIRAHVVATLTDGLRRLAVSTLARFVNGGAYTKGATGAGRMVLRIAELNSGPGGSTVYNELDVPEDKTARAGDILMSWSGSLGVYRWFREEAIINQHIFKVIPTGFPAWLVFDRLDAVMPIFRGVAADKATTMGHIQRGHLESTMVDVPSQTAIEQLDQLLSPLWDRLLLAEREIVKLVALRNALLPELLSGRFRVPAEETVSWRV